MIANDDQSCLLSPVSSCWQTYDRRLFLFSCNYYTFLFPQDSISKSLIHFLAKRSDSKINTKLTRKCFKRSLAKWPVATASQCSFLLIDQLLCCRRIGKPFHGFRPNLFHLAFSSSSSGQSPSVWPPPIGYLCDVSSRLRTNWRKE